MLIATGVTVIVVLTLMTGYFVAQEFAYMSVDRVRLAAQADAGDAAAQRALKVTRRTSFMLSGAQLGITVTGLLVGWRIRGSIVDAVAGYLLMVAFAFAMVWIGVLLGSLVPTPEGVMGIGFVALFPMTFIASTFVPIDPMPGPLKTVAAWNPITTLADALRQGFGNPNLEVSGSYWSVENPFLYTWLWIIGIVVICAPIAVRAYSRSLEK